MQKNAGMDIRGMEMKKERQQKILELVSEKKIGTQELLTKELRKAGFDVTQGTVSRDIRELGLTKAVQGKGRAFYEIQKQPEATDPKYFRILKEGYVSAEAAQNILVVKTVPGMAMAVAAALDEFRFSEIAGSIAGDDTIMCVVHDAKEAKNLLYKIQNICSKKEIAFS